MILQLYQSINCELFLFNIGKRNFNYLCLLLYEIISYQLINFKILWLYIEDKKKGVPKCYFLFIFY